jgi:hypothetical protein
MRSQGTLGSPPHERQRYILQAAGLDQLCFSGCDNVEMDTVLSPVQTNIRLEPDGQCRYVSISFPSQNIFARPNRGAFSWI